MARGSIRARTWAESYKKRGGLHLRPSSVFLPFSSSPDSELWTRNATEKKRRTRRAEGRRTRTGVLNQRSKKVGAGASQPAATMRRASKKSSSSAATASAGNAPAPGSLPPPIVLVYPDRVASSRAARMLPCSRDWIRVLFPLEDPISRPRRAGARWTVRFYDARWLGI